MTFKSVVWPDKRPDEHYPNCHRKLHWWSFRCTCAELEARAEASRREYGGLWFYVSPKALAKIPLQDHATGTSGEVPGPSRPHNEERP